MKREITMIIAAAASLAIALVAAGCGSSAGGYSSAPYGSPVQASAPSGIGVAASVGVANSRLGRIVVDNKGRTLYLFEKDKNRRSACYGLCATYWSPLLTHGKPVARTGVRQLLVGVTRRANGSEQVTYAGHPLYRFVEDRQAGQTKGEGLQEFGGGWEVLSPAGKKIESDG
jgi:predicted lipoprotein with Yx(FWY)xxD motif